MSWVWPVGPVEQEKRRLETLRYLARAPGYEAGPYLLMHHCREWGVPTSTDQIEQALTWLEAAALVALREAGGGVIARITPRGREVAEGHVRVPGVLPPDP